MKCAEIGLKADHSGMFGTPKLKSLIRETILPCSTRKPRLHRTARLRGQQDYREAISRVRITGLWAVGNARNVVKGHANEVKEEEDRIDGVEESVRAGRDIWGGGVIFEDPCMHTCMGLRPTGWVSEYKVPKWE